MLKSGIVCLLAACLLLPVAVWGQGINGAITGAVTDPAGARVPGAVVTATNQDTGLKFKGLASETGDYQILQLPPGIYNLEVAATGFKTAQRKDVRVQVLDRLSLNFSLEVGALSETVAVTGEVPLLRTDDAQLGQVIDSLMLDNLPQINRNPLDLLRLSGNIQGSGLLNTDGTTSGDTRINGGRTAGINYLVDGATIMTGKGHGVAASSVPTMESVSEFKVITNGIAAEYGRASGGIVELVTKGGTNQLHGQAYEYFWNQLLNANSWQSNTLGAEKSGFHKNDYGFLVGGPVYIPKVYNGKNRTFFLFDFNQLKYRTAANPTTWSVPTPAEKSGDLTGMLYAGEHALMYDPLGPIGKDADGNFIKLGLLGGDGMHVPTDRIDPLMKNFILPALKDPNRAPTPGYSQLSNFVGLNSTKDNYTSYSVRLDHNFTDRQHVYFRFKRDKDTNLSQQEWLNPLSPNDGQVVDGSIESTLAWDYTMTPTTVLSVRSTLNFHPGLRSLDFHGDTTEWPIDERMKKLMNNTPAYNMHYWSANQMGWGDMLQTPNQIPSGGSFTTGTVAASVSKIYSKHTIKTGFEHHRYMDSHFELFPGTIDFYNAAVAQANYGDPMWNYGSQGFASTWGSVLLGIPNDASGQGTITMVDASNYFAAFVQDDFKVNRRLTLNLGVRWDMETPMSERHDKIFGYDPEAPSPWTVNSGWNWANALASAGLSAAQIGSIPEPAWSKSGRFPNGAGFYAATPEHPGRTLTSYNPKHFAPRLGAAYQLDSRTVLRGSFGMMYVTRSGNYWESWVAGADTAKSSVYDRNPANGNVDHTLSDLWYDAQYIPFKTSTTDLNQALSSASGMISTRGDTPHEYNWSFSVQRQLPAATLFELSYNGNHSGDLLGWTQNAVFPRGMLKPQYASLLSTMVDNPVKGQIRNTGLTTGDQVPLGYLILDNPVFGGVTYGGANVGRSNYNALNVRIEKRPAHGVALLLNYTWSKSLDNVGGIDSQGTSGSQGQKALQSYQTPADAYGYSPLDETHRLVFYHDLQVPFGKGRKFLGSPSSAGWKILDKIAGGWEYAGTLTYRSGRPISFGPYTGDTWKNSGVGTLWGVITGDIGTVGASDYSGDSQVLRSVIDSQSGVRRFDASRFIATSQNDPNTFQVSNIPTIYPWIRQPGQTYYDGAVMKTFPLFREGNFLQIRMEAQNLFNIRGFGNYNTAYGDPNFGFITSAGQTERHIQLSARLVF